MKGGWDGNGVKPAAKIATGLLEQLSEDFPAGTHSLAGTDGACVSEREGGRWAVEDPASAAKVGIKQKQSIDFVYVEPLSNITSLLCFPLDPRRCCFLESIIINVSQHIPPRLLCDLIQIPISRPPPNPRTQVIHHSRTRMDRRTDRSIVLTAFIQGLA